MQSSSSLRNHSIIALCIIAAGALSFLPTKSFSQVCGGRGITVTSSGTEFLLVFMQNESPSYDTPPSRYQDIYLASNSDLADTVTISCRAFEDNITHIKWSKKIPLAARTSFVYHLSADPDVGFPNHDAILETDELLDSVAFKVVSNYPITCYGMSSKMFTADAFLAIPRNAATTNYVVMAYANSEVPQAMPSEFAVASFEENDTITITPSAITAHGNPAGQPITIVLDSGECIQIQTDPLTPLLDLTGSVVTAKKPVVVYGGSARTEVPTGFSIDGAVSRDHCSEAMPPTSTWGTSFITKNFGRPLGDIMRVLSNADPTTITAVKVNGNLWRNFKGIDFHDTVIRQSDTAELNIFTVESDLPVLVGMFANTADQSNNKLGDPFLAIVPPLDQTYNDLTYFITNDGTNFDLTNQFLTVATEISGAGTVSIGGIVIPKQAYTNVPLPIGGKKWAVTTLPQTPGIHRILSPNVPENGITILAYGWGSQISYGYTAGALLKPLHGIASLNTPTPVIASGHNGTPAIPLPSISVRNIMAEKIYFDSAEISYTQNPEHIAVRLKKDISLETGTLEMAEEKTLELTASQHYNQTITGSVRIWYHTALWGDLLPVDFPFVMDPQSQAGVNTTAPQSVLLENYPNPASGRTTVHFAIPQRAYASVKIIDALGRIVRTVMQGAANSGDQNIQVSTGGLTPGDYTLELLAPELGISVHRKMMVVE